MGRGPGVILVLAAILVAGCSQSGTGAEKQTEKGDSQEQARREVSVPVNVPAYDVSKEERCPIGNEDVKCITGFSKAKSGEEIEAITRELWSKNQGENALIVTLYPPRAPGADMSGTGYAFSDRSAARAVISSQYTASAGADIEGQVDEAMKNDGIYVISIGDEVRGAMQSVCSDPSLATTAECTNY
jgi:hypothetical protein